MAKQFIANAIQHKGRLRNMLHKKPGEKITPAELAMLENKAKKMGGAAGKSLMGAVNLARRFKSGDLSHN
jgi:hypothetical protein